MKITCGTDIIEISRIEKAINSTNGRFAREIYTQAEMEYCESKGKSKYEHYAARFAAKEAIFKAISPILEDKYSIRWQNSQILNDENGRPYVEFVNKKFEQIEEIDISISHCREYATATAVVIWKGQNIVDMDQRSR